MYGMDPKVGQLSYDMPQQGEMIEKPYSEATAEIVDEQARNLVDDAYKMAKEVITKHKEDLAKVGVLWYS